MNCRGLTFFLYFFHNSIFLHAADGKVKTSFWNQDVNVEWNVRWPLKDFDSRALYLTNTTTTSRCRLTLRSGADRRVRLNTHNRSTCNNRRNRATGFPPAEHGYVMQICVFISLVYCYIQRTNELINWFQICDEIKTCLFLNLCYFFSFLGAWMHLATEARLSNSTHFRHIMTFYIQSNCKSKHIPASDIQGSTKKNIEVNEKWKPGTAELTPPDGGLSSPCFVWT